MKPGFKKYAARESKKLQTQIRRDTIRELRDRIRGAQRRRKQALRDVRRQCRAARVRLRQQIQDRKIAARAALKNEITSMRTEARTRCKRRIERVRELGGSSVHQERARLRHQENLNQEIARTEGRLRRKHARAERTVRAESDDEVRSNLPDELVPVFDRVKKSIHGSPHMSRTEKFLHWAEENPDEVVSIQMMDADLAVERMIRDLQEQERQQK